MHVPMQVRLVWANALRYNKRDSDVGRITVELQVRPAHGEMHSWLRYFAYVVCGRAWRYAFADGVSPLRLMDVSSVLARVFRHAFL